jgi:hypothetical protein
LLEDKILIAGFFSSMDLLGFGMCRARILFRSSLGWNLMGKMLGSSNKKGTIKPKHQSSYLGFACSHSQSQSGRRTQFICTCSGLVKDWTTKTLKKVSKLKFIKLLMVGSVACRSLIAMRICSTLCSATCNSLSEFLLC